MVCATPGTSVGLCFGERMNVMKIGAMCARTVTVDVLYLVESVSFENFNTVIVSPTVSKAITGERDRV